MICFNKDKEKPKHGSIKKITKFLLLPRFFKGCIYWFEKVTLTYKYIESYTYLNGIGAIPDSYWYLNNIEKKDKNESSISSRT
jgi:hypothetical protein